MFYGREYETGIIEKAINSSRAELGIVYGRRRIGKSALLNRMISRKGDLYFEGLQKVPKKKQINHFLKQLSDQTKTPLSVADDWSDVFEILTFHIRKGKHFIVFDEFPWMASERTELISLLKYFWDNKWKENPRITLIICGSIASFMHKHIIHSKALHNRKTFEIKLQPLLINEAKLFFKNYRSNFEITKFLMLFGGIPKYLEQIDPTASLNINMDRLCFMKHCFFLNEFDTIFKEQFKVTRKYEKIIKFLAHKSSSKEELSQNLGIASGGGLTDYINTLEQADFIKTFTPKALFGKGEKTKKIVLWDEWLRFYFIYIEPNLNIVNLNTSTGLFDKITENTIKPYFGLCFERFCMKNISLILKIQGLDLSDVLGYGPYFRQRSRINPDNHGLQIDILIHRKGQILTLVECKFSSNPITTSVIKEVQQKLTLLKAPKNYSIERVLICSGEITPSLQKSEYFHKIYDLDTIFCPRV